MKFYTDPVNGNYFMYFYDDDNNLIIYKMVDGTWDIYQKVER